MAMKTTMSEIKYHTELVGSGGAGYSQSTYVSAVPQGTGGNERVGDRINMVALRYKAEYSLNSFLPGLYCSHTWSLVLDRQSNGATTLNVDDLYIPQSGASLIVFAAQRPDSYLRYEVLYESPTYTVTGTSTSPGSAYAHFVDEVISVECQTQLGPDPGFPALIPAFTNALFIVQRWSSINGVSGQGVSTLFFTD